MQKLPYVIVLVLVAALAFGVGYRVSQPPAAPTLELRKLPEHPPPVAGEAANRVTAVLARPASIERAGEFALLLQQLGPESIGEAREAFEALPVDVGELPSALFAAWWTRYEPEAAFEWVRDKRAFSKLTHSMAVREWARNDPQAAAQAIVSIAGTELRIAILRNLAFGWAESRIGGLDEYLRGLANPGEQQMAFEAYARWLVEHEGPQAAIDWAEAVPTDDLDIKGHAVARTAKEVAWVDPELAARFAEKHAASDYGWAVFRFVGRAWAQRDGRGAMEWLATVPEGRDRDKGVEGTYRAWLANDRAAALTWMRDRHSEAWLQPAMVYYSAALSHDSFPEGLAAAATIADQNSRDGVTVAFLRRWIAQDEAAARAWLDQADLSPEVIERAFAPEPKRPQRPGSSS